jgi:HAD superfamily hydrolase (TIGR01490 family)
MKPAALFDVDKTLVTVNTARLYVKWRMARNEAGFAEYLQMSKVLFKYALGILDPEATARKGFRAVAGYDEAQMRRECLGWYRKVVRPHISSDARRELEKRRREGFIIGLLSASTAYLTEPLAEDLGIEVQHVLCTRLQAAAGKLTGDYHRPLCYGAGKVEWARQWADEHGVDLARSAFYTDSISDLPMLEAVGLPHVINPDPRLRLLSLRRRYPMETWK